MSDAVVRVNAGWRLDAEGQAPRWLSRWFVCWRVFSVVESAGVLAGRLPDGDYVIRNFHVWQEGHKKGSLWLEGADTEAVPDVAPEVLRTMDELLDVVFMWNSPDEWAISNELELIAGREAGLVLGAAGRLEHRDGDPGFVAALCAKAGLEEHPGLLSPEEEDGTTRRRA